MNKSLISALLALYSLLLLAPVTAQEAQPTSTSQDCATTVLDARNTLEQGRDVTVGDIRIANISTFYANYPEGRPMSYRFKLRGSAVEDIMRSPQLMTMLSKDIIEHCDTVGKVSFNPDQTDWEESYGLLGQGIVGEFRCVEPGSRSGSSLAWGYNICP
jgi:hypothetical protein